MTNAQPKYPKIRRSNGLVGGKSAVSNGEGPILRGEGLISDGEGVILAGEGPILDGEALISSGEGLISDGEGAISTGKASFRVGKATFWMGKAETGAGNLWPGLPHTLVRPLAPHPNPLPREREFRSLLTPPVHTTFAAGGYREPAVFRCLLAAAWRSPIIGWD